MRRSSFRARATARDWASRTGHVVSGFGRRFGWQSRRPFDHWYLVNSMVVTKDSPLFKAIGGIHHIYINSVGLIG